ncbi:hypothetical protein SPRG_19180 [Saprolegnia parasitica CBS 223.65]|uniref:NADP-dependent oxidoreductase domain-containing protein n=1 Tax=Saprolegnia parasitica (strain CBS 223.65) TaxID=695850 RepID=A0A067D488_SAPPC|nr:hypothetical protein SPRG_19180 [Saprolegnia parasitica CBS 223.65]KDO33546.1 hypothetical protein SPRG_19180 [Saprolegnia parasitica CBS 223.65]|eukprot:XP_012195606.1 hypothetical protein SPRG_19180 [Saprolegnia parasitica CBS 223.65]
MLWLLALALASSRIAGTSTCAVGDLACATDGRNVRLSNGVWMPWVGQGLAGMKGDATTSAVQLHVAAGFRAFDGAQAKEWYDDVAAGNALAAIVQSTPSLSRRDFFIASKVHPAFLGRVEAAVREMFVSWHLSWEVDAIDLVYLHYPACGDWIPDCRGQPTGDWRLAWRELERLYENGKIRALGASNFDATQLQDLWAMATTPPHVVQMWVDPFHQANDERAFVTRRGGVVVGYSSLGTQWPTNPVWSSPVLQAIAAKHAASVASVVLSYFLQCGVAMIPRSTSLEHVQMNARLLEPHYAASLLDAQDRDAIAALDGQYEARHHDET